MENIAIEINNATIGYKSKIIASGINGSMKRGELVSLIGRNGCGKSTLLRTIAGFQPLLDGEILQEGRDIRKYSIQERARLLSIVMTNTKPVANMTVFELVAMGRSPYTGFWGKLSPADKEIITESLLMVGMEEYADRMVATLSDGERQKVLIAEAIAQKTPVIILDEPTSFLDYPSKMMTMKLLSKLAHDYDKCVFVSTHDLEQALQYSDMVWFLDEQQQLTVKTPDEMVSQGVLKEKFGYGTVDAK